VIAQCTRYQARYAKELCPRGDDASRQQGQSLLDWAPRSLRGLQRDPQGNLAVEPDRSETGIHWRRVQTLPAGEREAGLECLVSAFERAAVHLNRGGVDPLDQYSRLLWLAGNLMPTALHRADSNSRRGSHP
jgi:hypothetical protein